MSEKSSWGSSVMSSTNQKRRKNALGDYRTCRNDRVLAYCYAIDDSRTCCDPNDSLNHDGPCDYRGAPMERVNWVARSDGTDVRPDHDIVGNVEFAKVSPVFIRIVERQTADSGGDRDRSIDVC